MSRVREKSSGYEFSGELVLSFWVGFILGLGYFQRNLTYTFYAGVRVGVLQKTRTDTCWL